MDCFSRLPDELVIHILSFLSTYEAATTSILSERWRNLWKLTSAVRIFSKYDSTPEESSFEESSFDDDVEYERQWVQFIDSILSSFENPNSYPLHEISIEEPLEFNINDNTPHVERWISFAVAHHNVQVLRVHLDMDDDGTWSTEARYCRFPPPSSCDRNYNLMHLSLYCCELIPAFEGFGNLRSIKLQQSSRITDAALESINFNCPLLEQLVLDVDGGLENLRVLRSLHCLKHLKICCCKKNKTLFIDSPNLESFEFSGEFPSNSYTLMAPKLKDLALLGATWTPTSVLALFRQSKIGEIRKLSLRLDSGVEQDFDHSRLCPLNHVKELILVGRDKDFTGLDAILRASSSLESLKLSLEPCCLFEKVQFLPFGGSRSGGKWKHQSLRKIQIESCCHYPCKELGLLEYLFEVGVETVEMKIVLRCSVSAYKSKIEKHIKDSMRHKVSCGAKLIICCH